MKRYLVGVLLVLSVVGIPAAAFAIDSLTPSTSVTIQNQSTSQAPAPSNACGWSCPLSYVLAAIMGLFAYLTAAAGLELGASVYYTVVQMGNFVHQINGIGVAWSVFRDVGNLILIFGFLAIGITTILGVNWYGGGTKMLPTLLIAAVFLNFSLFISEAVIDVGNLFAVQVYKEINGGTLPASGPSFTGTALNSEPISNDIMNSLGLQGLYSSAANNQTTGQIAQTLSTNNIQYVAFLGIILFIVAAFVMFSLAFILMARFVVLIMLMVTAPVGFAGLAVPKMEKTANAWWSMLFQQTITAPVLLFLLYVALAVITDAQFLNVLQGCTAGTSCTANTASAWWNAAAVPSSTASSQFAVVLFTFLIAMALLLMCVVAAQRMGAAGAGWATKVAGKLSFGVAGFAGRNTVGRLSYYAGRGIRASMGNNALSRYIAKPFDYGSKASFDLRGTGALKGVAGIEAGAAQRGGYKKEVDDTKKAQLEYAKTLSSEDTREYKAAKERADAAKRAADRADKNFEEEKDPAKLEAARLARDTARADAEKANEELAKIPKNQQVAYARSAEQGSNILKMPSAAVGAGVGALLGAIGAPTAGIGDAIQAARNPENTWKQFARNFRSQLDNNFLASMKKNINRGAGIGYEAVRGGSAAAQLRRDVERTAKLTTTEKFIKDLADATEKKEGGSGNGTPPENP